MWLRIAGEKKSSWYWEGGTRGPNGTGKARLIDFMRTQTTGKEEQ